MGAARTERGLAAGTGAAQIPMWALIGDFFALIE